MLLGKILAQTTAKFCKRFLIFIFCFYTIPIFSFPIPFHENWKVFVGKNLDYSNTSNECQPIKLTFRPSQIQNLPQTNVLLFTLYRELELSQSTLENLEKDIGVYFPFITNVYEIYFNGEKIDGRGKIDSERVLENGTNSGYILLLPRKLLKEGSNE